VGSLCRAEAQQAQADEQAQAKRTREELAVLQLMKDADELLCIYANNSGAKSCPG
jgi:hypothetical protein